MASFSIGGVGAAPTVESVASVACGAVMVHIDSAAAERIKKESPKSIEAVAGADTPAADQNVLLSAAQARAAVYARLLSLTNGKTGVRLSVIEWLASLLNGAGPDGRTAQPLPALPAATEAELMRALAAAFPAGLSAPEHTVLTSGGSASAGLGALLVTWGHALVGAATAVAALSLRRRPQAL